jgi:hypothetical protein
MLKENQQKTQHFDVLNWLSAPVAALDQEAAAEVRREYPASGQWLLQDSKMTVWMDFNNSLVPMLWINGIPGAGKKQTQTPYKSG